jgi:hypothetical protein
MLTPDIIQDGEGIRVGRDGQVSRIVHDKGVVRVPLLLMDEKTVTAEVSLNRPGPRYASDAAADERREVAFDGYLSHLSGAWRQPDPSPGAVTDAKPPTGDAREVALAARDADLVNAWKGSSA